MGTGLARLLLLKSSLVNYQDNNEHMLKEAA